MTKVKCPECGGRLEARAVAHGTQVGPYRVTDGSASAHVCQACGEYDLPAQDLAAYELRAVALVLREVQTPSGDALRFARRALGLRQADLGALLDVRSETVCRWEAGTRPISRASRLAFVALVEGVRDGRSVDAELAAARAPGGPAPLTFEVPPRRVA